MNINTIQIEKLFDLFDYNISFEREENVLIITGPNGHGKTMILNIIYNLFNKRYSFFKNLIFRRIVLKLDGNYFVIIHRNSVEEKSNLNFTLNKGNTKIDSFTFSRETNRESMRQISNIVDRYTDLRRVAPEKWYDPHRAAEIDAEDLLDYTDTFYGDALPMEWREILEQQGSKKFDEVLGKLKVHLIREQRLFKNISSAVHRERYSHQTDGNMMSETIKIYAKELTQLIAQFSKTSFIQTQELDSSYPARLRGETNILSEIEYGKKYQALKEKQKQLSKFGLYESKQEFLTYTQDDAKALSVYLKDLEKKLGVFDPLLIKMELFTSILNERRFTFKSIKINREEGFFFETVNKKALDLSQLSSGEQHEVVLLYELIFNVSENILVLIDEPEISLHVTWQKEFLKDLLKIAKMQNIQVVIATHSPAIINGRWDLVYNLLETEQ